MNLHQLRETNKFHIKTISTRAYSIRVGRERVRLSPLVSKIEHQTSLKSTFKFFKTHSSPNCTTRMRVIDVLRDQFTCSRDKRLLISSHRILRSRQYSRYSCPSSSVRSGAICLDAEGYPRKITLVSRNLSRNRCQHEYIALVHVVITARADGFIRARGRLCVQHRSVYGILQRRDLIIVSLMAPAEMWIKLIFHIIAIQNFKLTGTQEEKPIFLSLSLSLDLSISRSLDLSISRSFDLSTPLRQRSEH
jgi:hypothetical protein